MMEVIKYLKENSLEKLVEEFKIVVTDYPDRVVLNYDQIESPKYNPICDECRALILRKDTWEVMSRAFDRFYNVGEGETHKTFPVQSSRIYEKLDGSLISVYNDGNGWQPATRKMAYAEGETSFGITFNDLFNEAVKGTNLFEFLKSQPNHLTFIFELTSPINRVVTPYTETKVTLIGMRNNLNGREGDSMELDLLAELFGVSRPKSYQCNNIEDVIALAENLPTLDEGFVLVFEKLDGSHLRMKCKNSKYLAISHLRNNGAISPRRILTLVMDNEQDEYLSYFPEDKSYFDFVKEVWNESFDRMREIWEKCKDIESQKDFAIAVNEMSKHSHEAGIMFRVRKGANMLDAIRSIGDTKDSTAKKLAKNLNLKDRFAKKFGFVLEDE